MARTQATVCFLPWARRKSATAASSSCSERIASGPLGASSGPEGGITVGWRGNGCGSDRIRQASPT